MARNELAPYQERERNNIGKKTCSHYQQWLEETKKFQAADALRPKVLKAEDQPWEFCQQGKLRHCVNRQLNLKEYAVDMYVQEIAPGSRSGRHYHASEEMVFILEGEGYDLHWDPAPLIKEKYHWQWEQTPKKFEWKAGFFTYIPPLVQHQHFNASKTNRTRILCNTCRTLVDLGYDWLTQVENAPEWDALQAK